MLVVVQEVPFASHVGGTAVVAFPVLRAVLLIDVKVETSKPILLSFFPSVLMLRAEKLDCLSLSSLSSLNLRLRIKPDDTRVEHLSNVSLRDRLLATVL